MKKLISLALSILLLSSLIACEKEQNKSSSSDETTTLSSTATIPINNDFLNDYAITFNETKDVIFEHANENVTFKIPKDWNYYFVSRNFPESDFISIGIINENHDSIISITKDKSINFANNNSYNISSTNINDKTYTLYQSIGCEESIMIVPYINNYYTIGYNSSEFSDYDKQVLYNILASLEINN